MLRIRRTGNNRDDDTSGESHTADERFRLLKGVPVPMRTAVQEDEHDTLQSLQQRSHDSVEIDRR